MTSLMSLPGTLPSFLEQLVLFDSVCLKKVLIKKLPNTVCRFPYKEIAEAWNLVFAIVYIEIL